MTKQQTRSGLQERRDTSPVSPASAEPLNATGNLSPDRNPEESLPLAGGGPHVGVKPSTHSVWVLDKGGHPLTPTTPAKARKMMKAGVAKPVWNRFNQFGIQMMVSTRDHTPETVLGVDHGTKFEGYAVVCGIENNLAVKLDLPSKKTLVKKLEARRQLRRARRFRNCRRRPCRFDNRSREGFLAPSQAMIVGSRIKMLREFFRCYPIQDVSLEDVKFDHAHKRWGANFSTVEIGKARIREFIKPNAKLHEFRGWDTKEFRMKYGYRKISDKSADRFEAHCSDALALACEVGPGERIAPGRMIVVDDTYRPARRQLHDAQPAQGGVRARYSRGTVFGLRKGLLVGRPDGNQGRLCGEYRGGYRYYDQRGRRQSTKKLSWACGHFITRPGKEAEIPPSP